MRQKSAEDYNENNSVWKTMLLVLQRRHFVVM